MDKAITRPRLLLGAAALLCLLVVPITATGSVRGSGNPQATASGVKKQIKKLKRKVKNLQQQVDELELQPGPQGPPGEQGIQGEQGLPGQPGQDATNLFAYIRDGGSADTANVQYGNGVAVADPAGNSFYQVFFNQSIVNCVVHATAGIGDPAGTSPAIAGSFPTFDMSGAAANEVTVTFINTAASVTDTAFVITVFC